MQKKVHVQTHGFAGGNYKLLQIIQKGVLFATFAGCSQKHIIITLWFRSCHTNYPTAFSASQTHIHPPLSQSQCDN